jgi:hypothetical protein
MICATCVGVLKYRRNCFSSNTKSVDLISNESTSDDDGESDHDHHMGDSITDDSDGTDPDREMIEDGISEDESAETDKEGVSDGEEKSSEDEEGMQEMEENEDNEMSGTVYTKTLRDLDAKPIQNLICQT